MMNLTFFFFFLHLPKSHEGLLTGTCLAVEAVCFQRLTKRRSYLPLYSCWLNGPPPRNLLLLFSLLFLFVSFFVFLAPFPFPQVSPGFPQDQMMKAGGRDLL